MHKPGFPLVAALFAAGASAAMAQIDLAHPGPAARMTRPADSGSSRSPAAGRGSANTGQWDANGFRASEIKHAVRDANGDAHLGRSTDIRARAQRVTDHPFVAADRSLRQCRRL
jgi:hypothetical protein